MISSSVQSSAVMSVTTLVSVPKPAPATFRLFATIISAFFFASFAFEFSSIFWVSIEKPHMSCPLALCAPRYESMSSVRSSSITDSYELSFFFIFSSAGCDGQKSATAAVMMIISCSAAFDFTTSAMSAADVTFTTSTNIGGSTDTEALTSVTCAPRSIQFSAMARPILPVE